MSMFCMFNYNFGPENKTRMIPQHMQKLLLSTQQKEKHHKQKDTLKRKKAKKVLLEFPKSNQGAKMSTRISKTMVGMSIKRGCQWSFIAKQPYLNPSLYQLIYLNLEHKNKQGEVYHGKVVVGYWHTLGSQLSDSMKAHLMGLLQQGLSSAQVMDHHMKEKKGLKKWAHNMRHICFTI